MRIAVWHNLPGGGGKRALYYHVKGLVGRGHEVEAWCPATTDQTYLPLSRLIREHVVPFQKVRPSESSGPLRTALGRYQEVSRFVRSMDSHCRQCAEEVDKGRFDILLANSSQFLSVASIGRFRHAPKVLYLQEPNRSLYEANPRSPWPAIPSAKRFWWSPSYLRWFLEDLVHAQSCRLLAREEQANARAYDLVLVNSLFSRESVKRAYGIEARVCFLGVDTQVFSPRDVPRERFVVGLGSLQPLKNVAGCIRAVASIEKNKRPELVWIGNVSDASYQRRMEELAGELAVTFTPKVMVSDNGLIDILSRASVMIYAPHLEPFGLAPLEANACGVPVVGIAEGGLRETIRDGVNGILVPDGDFVRMGHALLRYLDSPSLAQEVGKRAREYVVANWTLEKAIDSLEESLTSVAENAN